MHLLLALAATTATPVKEPPSVESRPVASSPVKSKPDIDPKQTIASMIKLFDKFFPAGPEPDPARLALARQATMTMFPNGAYAQALTKFVDRTVDNVLSMSEADFVEMLPPSTDKGDKKDAPPRKLKKAGPPSTDPLRVALSRKDPNFDAKLAAIRAFAGVMFVKFGDVAEPKLREGISRSLARKFDARQLADIHAFLATPTGAAYGREMVGLWFEPEVMRGTFQLFPEVMKMMPGMTKDASAFDAQMKALGKVTSDKKSD